MQHKSLSTRSADLHLTSEGVQIPRLEVNSPRTLEFASKTFPRTQARNDATRRNTLHVVLAIPSYKMAIVNIILLALCQLIPVRVSRYTLLIFQCQRKEEDSHLS